MRWDPGSMSAGKSRDWLVTSIVAVVQADRSTIDTSRQCHDYGLDQHGLGSNG
jgi:hypothetical protein